MNKNSLKVSSETSLSYWSSLEKFGGTKSQSTQLAHLVNKYHAHVHAKLLQSFLTLWDYSLPDPSVHGILQETVLKWVLCPPPGIFLTQDSNPYLSLFFFNFILFLKLYIIVLVLPNNRFNLHETNRIKGINRQSTIFVCDFDIHLSCNW